MNFPTYTLIIILLLFFSTRSAFSSVRGTPQSAAFGSIKFILEIYKDKNHGDLPKSWDTLIESGIFSGQVLTDSRRYLDVENRYIFVDLKPMQFGNHTERVLIMARQAGGEGDNNDAEDPEKIKGRLLIVEASDGSIQTRKYSEVMLQHWFEKAGLSLAEFTSDAPPSPEFSSPPKNLNQNDSSPNSEGKSLSGEKSEEFFDQRSVPLLLWIGGGLVVVLLIGFLIRQKRSK
jgi:hypothetical protein